MLLLNRHIKILPIIAKFKKNVKIMLLKRRFFWFGRLWRRKTEAGQSLQERDTKTGASGRCVFARLKVDLVISIHLSITFLNFLRKVIKTALLQ